MSKLTPKNQALLVLDLMNYDLFQKGWNDREKLDYLRIIGDRVDDLGEEILRSDEAVLPRQPIILSPLEFVLSSECLKGDDALEWLYLRKYTTESNHIHILPEELCINLASEYPQWIEPDGVKDEGSIWYLIVNLYEEYKRRCRL